MVLNKNNQKSLPDFLWLQSNVSVNFSLVYGWIKAQFVWQIHSLSKQVNCCMPFQITNWSLSTWVCSKSGLKEVRIHLGVSFIIYQLLSLKSAAKGKIPVSEVQGVWSYVLRHKGKFSWSCRYVWPLWVCSEIELQLFLMFKLLLTSLLLWTCWCLYS